MELSHRFTVPASVDVAWEAFNDLERITPCFPGASLTSYDGETFEGICKVKLGPVSLQYGGSGRFLERDESAYRAVIQAKGKDKRGNGTAAATITAQLTSTGEAVTDVIVSTDLNVTGRPAQFGRGVMQDVSDKLLAQFASCLETKLAEPGVPAVGDTGAAGSADGEGGQQEQEGQGSDDAAGSGEVGSRFLGGQASPAQPSPADPGTSRAAKSAVMSADREPSEGATPQHRADSSAAPASAAPASAAPASAAPAAAAPAELNLATTVLPALLKRYAPYAAGGVAGLWLLRKLFRR